MILRHLKKAALKLGIDVRRATETPSGRLSILFDRYGVDCVLDIGANRGQYGAQLRSTGYNGTIISFEPLPNAYHRLAARARKDPQWFAHNLAVSNEDGILRLNIAGNKGNVSSSVLPMLPRHLAAAPDSKYVDSIEVPARRLDTIWQELVPPTSTTLIKVDVQGFERAVLDGAVRSLKRTAGLQLEISLVPLYQGALSLREVLDRADTLGMTLVHVDPGFFDPRTGELLQMDGVFFRADDTSPESNRVDVTAN